MKILLQYLKPYKLLVMLVLVLAAINIGFSLLDPIIFGRLVNLSNDYIPVAARGRPLQQRAVLLVIFVGGARRGVPPAPFHWCGDGEPHCKKLPGLFLERYCAEVRRQSVYRRPAARHEAALPRV
jgi:hypothetical protein